MLYSLLLHSKKHFLSHCIRVPIPFSFLCSWACIGGIWRASTTSLTILVIWTLISCAYIWCKKSFRSLIPLCFFFVGGLRFTFYHGSFEQSADFFQSHSQQLFSGKARVIEYSYLKGKRYSLSIIIKIISLNNVTLPTRSTITLYLLRRAAVLEPGDEIKFQLQAHLKRPNTFYEKFLFKEGIVASIYTDSFKYQRTFRPSFNLRRSCKQKRQTIMKSLMRKFSPHAGALFSTLFMGGKKTTYSQELSLYFAYWGIVHFLARSGLHVMVLVSVWRTILIFLRIPWIIAQIMLFLMLSVYYLLSWPSISFIRACMTWYQGLLFLGKSPKILHILSITTLLVLLYNPYHLFFLDFQLSFWLTCALAWWQEASYQHTILVRAREIEQSG